MNNFELVSKKTLTGRNYVKVKKKIKKYG